MLGQSTKSAQQEEAAGASVDWLGVGAGASGDVGAGVDGLGALGVGAGASGDVGAEGIPGRAGGTANGTKPELLLLTLYRNPMPQPQRCVIWSCFTPAASKKLAFSLTSFRKSLPCVSTKKMSPRALSSTSCKLDPRRTLEQ